MRPRSRTRTSPTSRPYLAALAVLVLAVGAAGCGGDLVGRYENAAGVGCLDFQAGGTVFVTLYGGTFAGTYELAGDRVIVRGPAGAQVFVLDGERLDGDYGMTFLKEALDERQGD